MPIYKVVETIADKSEVRLVDAKNAAQAVRHVTRKSIACDVVDTADAVALGKKGVEIEKAATE
jgi:hypothetical protein